MQNAIFNFCVVLKCFEGFAPTIDLSCIAIIPQSVASIAFVCRTNNLHFHILQHGKMKLNNGTLAMDYSSMHIFLEKITKECGQ